jgi:hypothetical protein
MPPLKHAVLSASSAHRWLNCAPSARLEQTFADRETQAAAEGSAAHALAEHKLRRALKLQTKRPVSAYDSDEMDAYTDGYVQFVWRRWPRRGRNARTLSFLIEQKLDFSRWVPEGFGTGDALIVADDTLHILDLKYGQGVLVEAERNPQMMLYALGALTALAASTISDDPDDDLSAPQGEHLRLDDPRERAHRWAEDTLKPLAALAYEGRAKYRPGGWCLFCRAAVRCRARAEANLELAKYEFAVPPLLSDAEIGNLLGRLDSLIQWADELKAYALTARCTTASGGPAGNWWRAAASASTPMRRP